MRLTRPALGIDITGFRDPVKDRVTFKLVPSEYGYRVFGAYLNGKRCREIPSDQEKQQSSKP